MKPRRVMLMIELDTDMPLPLLRRAWHMTICGKRIPVRQVHANVVRPEKNKKK